MTARADIPFLRATLRRWRHAIWLAPRIMQAREAVSRRAPLRADRLSNA